MKVTLTGITHPSKAMQAIGIDTPAKLHGEENEEELAVCNQEIQNFCLLQRRGNANVYFQKAKQARKI